MQTLHSSARCAPRRELQSISSQKYLSIPECKSLSKRGKYVNFSAKVLEIISKQLSGTAFKLWQFISAESVFDENWNVQIKIKTMAAYLKRSARQVSRLITELCAKEFLEILSSHKGLYGVRLPAAIADEFKPLKPRRDAVSHDKNVMVREPHSYYLNNNINNNRDSSELERVEPKQSEIVVDRAPEIEKLENEKVELNNKFTELSKEGIKQPGKLLEIYEIQREIGQKIAHIDLKIDRLKPSTPKRPSVFGLRFKDSDKILLTGLLLRINKSNLHDEITFSVCRGDLGRGNITRGIYSALKIIMRNEWTTPMGMCQRR